MDDMRLRLPSQPAHTVSFGSGRQKPYGPYRRPGNWNASQGADFRALCVPERVWFAFTCLMTNLSNFVYVCSRFVFMKLLKTYHLEQTPSDFLLLATLIMQIQTNISDSVRDRQYLIMDCICSPLYEIVFT